MIWIIGGTSETGQVLEKIRGRAAYIVTVATPVGQEVLTDTNVRIARLGYAAMLDFIHTYSIDAVVDLSHPYAVDVSQNACQACRDMGIRYIRFLREPSVAADAVYVASVAACLTFLRTVRGCVFFTTGSKNISDFQQVRGNNRFIYRVLPTPDSLETCAAQQVAMRDIVAILGPVSEDLNVAMFKEYHANYVVMKNSGQAGGTPEKLAACHRLGITPVMLGRPPDDGISDLDAVVKLILGAENPGFLKNPGL